MLILHPKYTLIMKTFRKDNTFSYKQLLYKCAIFIVTVSIIVYFMPKEGKFNYQFELNKPWKYGLLQASFDFPIYKGEDQVKAEQDSILKFYSPYYHLNAETGQEMIEKLKKDYNDKSLIIKEYANYKRHIEKTLEKIYETGVISPNDMEQLKQEGTSTIQTITENTAIQRNVNEIYTIKEAYEKLINADTIHFNKILLQQCNLNDYIVPNLTYDSEKSMTARQELLSNISWATGYVMNGQKIIDRGEIIDQKKFDILRSMQKEWNNRSETVAEKRLTLFGQILFASIMVALFMVYLEIFRRDFYKVKGKVYLLFSIIIVFPVIAFLMVEHAFLSVYIVPFAMIPMLIKIFLDSRTAFMAHIVTILITSIALRTPHEFILLQAVAGMAAIYSLRELSQRSQLLNSAFLVTITYSLLYLALDLVHVSEIAQLSTYVYMNFVINGLLLLFTYPLLFILEKTFGFTSNVTLVELSNINTKLMREMSEIAPGTFQHSLQLANLTAAAANRIGANSQLVRTGAMYHDIGKMMNPAFFTENQSGVNPHNQLNYKQSAQIVISHVTDGLKLADKHNLPSVIKEFISTHHGNGLTKYFYISYQNEHPDEEVDKTVFQYPGPNPFTKEQAILMMADSVEAASRSLHEYTEESISALVEKIIDSQVQDGYFKECPITFKDIATVKSVFKEKLKTMYHTRISYPELKK